MVTVGIIGLGQMGIIHSAILNAVPDSRVSAICEKDSRLSRIASKVVPSINFYADYQEMLEKEPLQGLFICTPASTHAPILLDLKAKSHKIAVFTEKPLATTSTDANMVADAYASSGRIGMVGFQKRFAGPFKKGKEFLDKGVLGEIAFFKGQYYTSESFGGGKGPRFDKESGGATLEFGVHLLDMILWYFGDPTSVESTTKSIFNASVDDYSHAMLGFKGGVVGYADICWSMRNYRPSELMIEVHGKHGTMNITEDRLILYLDKDGILPAGTHLLHASTLTESVPYLLAYPENTLEDIHFLNCIARNEQPMTDFQSAAKVNRLADKIRRV
jgi:predicted dehydrogenase